MIPFGALFALPGLAAMAAGIKDGEFVAIPFGFLFVVIGSIFVFGRKGLILDTESGAYEKWHGLLTPMKRAAGRLDRIDRVELKVQRGDDSTWYIVTLRSGDFKLDAFQSGNTEEARAEALFLAKALKVKISDGLGGGEILLDPDHLNESLRERRARTGDGTAKLPPLPGVTRATYKIEGDCLEIELPKKSLAAAYVPLVLVFGFCAGVYFIILRPLRVLPMPGNMQAITVPVVIGAFIGIPILTGLLASYRTRVARMCVRVSRDGIQTEARGIIREKRETIPAREVVAILTGKPVGAAFDGSWKECVIVRYGAKSLCFGGNLPAQEKEWIRAALEKMLG